MPLYLEFIGFSKMRLHLRPLSSKLSPHQKLLILDLENIRLHYAKTLLEWLARFDQNITTIRSMYDESFVRAWRLYLAGCAASFMSASLQLFQVVFTHTENNKLSLTREHLYRDEPAKIWQFD